MANILIADDDDILVDLISFRLQGAGHQVICASDGETALANAIGLVPDLIVLDTMMPMLSGLEVLAVLKQDARTAAIPVIMLTARRGEGDIVGALEAGAADYLTKPFIPGELISRVAMHLQRGSPRAA